MSRRFNENGFIVDDEPPRPAPVTPVEALADAMWQLLDDMGKSPNRPCLAALAQARIAYEPFRDKDDEDWPDWLSLAEAKKIIAELGI